jgi:hypothetical protein
VKTDSNGYATVTTLQTGCVITINFTFPLTNFNVYCIFIPSGFVLVYPSNNAKITYHYGFQPITEPLTPHPWESIPNPPPTPPSEPPIPPTEPLPTPEIPRIGSQKSFPLEFVIGITFVFVGILGTEKSVPIPSRKKKK